MIGDSPNALGDMLHAALAAEATRAAKVNHVSKVEADGSTNILGNFDLNRVAVAFVRRLNPAR